MCTWWDCADCPKGQTVKMNPKTGVAACTPLATTSTITTTTTSTVPVCDDDSDCADGLYCYNTLYQVPVMHQMVQTNWFYGPRDDDYGTCVPFAQKGEICLASNCGPNCYDYAWKCAEGLKCVHYGYYNGPYAVVNYVCQ